MVGAWRVENVWFSLKSLTTCYPVGRHTTNRLQKVKAAGCQGHGFWQGQLFDSPIREPYFGRFWGTIDGLVYAQMFSLLILGFLAGVEALQRHIWSRPSDHCLQLGWYRWWYEPSTDKCFRCDSFLAPTSVGWHIHLTRMRLKALSECQSCDMLSRNPVVEKHYWSDFSTLQSQERWPWSETACSQIYFSATWMAHIPSLRGKSLARKATTL